MGEALYTITATFVSGDPLYLDSQDTAVLTVSEEDATVTPAGVEPGERQVNTPGGVAGPVVLEADVVEAADGSLGDIARAQPVTFALVPQLPPAGTVIACTANRRSSRRARCAPPACSPACR